jgi:membrane protein YdbS with pleckstrin-like domain
VPPGPGSGGPPADQPAGSRREHDTEPLPRVPGPPHGSEPRAAPRRNRRRFGNRASYLEASGMLDEPPDVVAAGDPVPSPMVFRYLFTSEHFVGEWRRHWSMLWLEMVVLVVATFLLGYLAGMTGHVSNLVVGTATAVWGVVVLWVSWRVGDWYYDRFVLTSRRVMVVSGMVNRKVAMMPLARVTDMAYNQSVLGRMLGYGSFILESAGQDQALREVHHLPQPRELYLLMLDEMYGPDPRPRPERRRRDSTSGGD